jgi:hypothetical protein
MPPSVPLATSPAMVDRDGSPTAVWVPHDVVAAPDPVDHEAVPFKCLDNLVAGDGR